MTECKARPVLSLEEKCETCDGTGAYLKSQCEDCGGVGVVPTEFGESVLRLVRHNIRCIPRREQAD